MQLNKIYNIDCFEGVDLLEDESVDLIITSPPYNVDLGNNKYNKNGYDLYDDNKDYRKYIDDLVILFIYLKRKLKSGGRLCINIGDGKNGAIPTHADLIWNLQQYYIPMTTIIWDKKSTSNRCAWGSWMSPSSPSFPKTFEYILVFAKDFTKLQYKGETDLTREEFIKWSLVPWVFPGETKKIGHPAPFPEELPKRCIKMFSWIGATVLDPFAGSGTTLKVAKELDRNFIGFEISPEYCEIANARIK